MSDFELAIPEDDAEETGERLPETEYPTQEQVLGVGFPPAEGKAGQVSGEEPETTDAAEGDPNLGDEEPAEEGEPETPATELDAKKIKARLKVNKGGRPRIPDGVMGVLARTAIKEKPIADYVHKLTEDLKKRLEAQQDGALRPEQDQMLLMNASQLTNMLRAQEISRLAPEILADSSWVAKMNAMHASMQRIFKLLGLYAAPKLKEPKRGRPDMAELLRKAKERINRGRGKA